MNVTTHTPALTFVLALAVGAAVKPNLVVRVPTDESLTGPARRSPSISPRFPSRCSRWHRREPAVDAMATAVWCDELARAVRSGATLAAALRTSPTSAGIDSTVAEICLALDRGRSTSEAVTQATTTSVHVALALTVLRACAEHGGPAAEPLDRAAATLRARAADRADRLTQSAQARMSALVMTCLPIGMLALMLITSGSVRAAATSPLGATAILIGATLNVCGWTWMRRTIDRHTG